jgi:DNA processing protein
MSDQDHTELFVGAQEVEARLLAAQVPGLAGGLMRRLIQRYGSVRVALGADGRELEALLGPKVGRLLADGEGVRERWLTCERGLARVGARARVWGGAGYPDGLNDLSPPPPVVYVRGRMPPGRGVGVVGTRTASKAACDEAARLAAGVVEAGRFVVSGGAYGIDAGAHVGALDAGGDTVVVFGGGLDRPYPDRHIALFERVARQGSLLSAFRPGIPPLRGGFLARNAIIAALSDVVVVVNAGWRSGARSTALAARRLGRLVCVVPGSPGCDRLLSEGATAVRSSRDVLGFLSGQVPGDIPGDGHDAVPAALLPEGDANDHAVLAALDGDGSTADSVVSQTGMEPGRVLAVLMAMVLDGRVAQRPGGRFFRTRGPVTPPTI